MIYTSYFSKIAKLPESFIPISICAKSPQGFKGLCFKELAPKYQILMNWKNDHDNQKYIVEYHRQVLENLNAATVVAKLKQLAGDKTICLVCYEKSGDFCHRHLVAEWLSQNGFECKEYDYQPVVETSEQLTFG